ncbi:MAG: MBL fold metallo-hydrolase [Oscillospiraceae bacterium]|nr:MBL fold metallo-hydrolase [Oscillospiraceae bacterium]
MANYTYEKLNSHLYRIRDALGVAMYLAVGEKQAALVDTGYGLVGLRELVESLTDLPAFVLLTHGHLDHAPGVYEFDTVYIHPADQELFVFHSDPERRRNFLAGQGINADEYVFQSQCSIDLLPVEDGQVFDLGGLHIRAFHVPGHTQGMTMYLFEEDRLMLFGDACGPNTMIMEDCSSKLGDYYEALKRIKAHEGDYDGILRNHGTCQSEKDLLDNVMAVCQRILAGTDDHVLLPDAMQKMLPSALNPVPLSYSARAMEMTEKGTVYPDGLGEGNIYYRQDKV